MIPLAFLSLLLLLLLLLSTVVTPATLARCSDHPASCPPPPPASKTYCTVPSRLFVQFSNTTICTLASLVVDDDDDGAAAAAAAAAAEGEGKQQQQQQQQQQAQLFAYDDRCEEIRRHEGVKLGLRAEWKDIAGADVTVLVPVAADGVTEMTYNGTRFGGGEDYYYRARCYAVGGGGRACEIMFVCQGGHWDPASGHLTHWG
ncbi:hypothetical protein MBM_01089 [Drepanopeziza brunnea f. sp. 'multigermtubi' MB_m1]|uniref:Uncharacterized protein n=1 Tax=Marssonina brunnea f. sp. multigermtubi (strain MB_m1) TaxID=1072389 RepID=K1X5L4_MARBU|nr:uncharacterized protein MBM_01089 [Drepanopeziza brunnea f. sp. 'multigermtubi' MB_m1]EKD20407.1 hypothetical protein MBM_01089 [Drepanopeziza brunnea f. sp. 'multigermtubi' MB_m1]